MIPIGDKTQTMSHRFFDHLLRILSMSD